MGRRLAAASNERIYIGSAAGLAGFDFRFGTFAMCLQNVSVSLGHSYTVLCTNDASTTGADLYFHNTSKDLNFYGTTNSDSTSTLVVTASENLILAVTKATGSATPRMHMHKFATAAWTHGAGSATVGDAAATTAFAIGAYDNAGGSDQLDAEIFAIGVWKYAMTDSEVERLAGGRWLNFAPDFYEQSTDGHEVGDMVRTLGRYQVKQTARTGTTRGTLKPPPGFRMDARRRRR